MRELDPRRTTYSQSPLNEPWLTKTINILCFFGFGFFSGTLVPENLLNLLWLILKPYKTFMHKHTFSGPGARLKRARTLGPEKSRTLEFSNPADPDLGPGEFENHMKCFHVLTNPTHEMNFDLCFFCACPKCSLQLQQQSTCTRIHKPVDLIHTYFPSLKSRKYTNTHRLDMSIVHSRKQVP